MKKVSFILVVSSKQATKMEVLKTHICENWNVDSIGALWINGSEEAHSFCAVYPNGTWGRLESTDLH